MYENENKSLAGNGIENSTISKNTKQELTYIEENNVSNMFFCFLLFIID